ncbi:hypothetical protein ACN27J_09505 [Solwaraspora sp. WMMB762]|uniref:hypothetical protein n=1 Tax=Solwaraspora sp. WMMB762 TaxID=3404120 RepID=UPI003B94971A
MRATIWPAAADRPVVLTHSRHYGFSKQLGQQAVVVPPVSTGLFGIDDIAEDGAPALAATYEVVTGLFQAFGQPEALQVSREGALRMRYWRNGRADLERWAARVGVELSQKTVG